MIIIGAGMAGLLAAGMLRNEASGMVEKQPELPNNHTALLRFRSSIVGDTLNIPFKKINVMKAVDSGGMNPVAAMLAYSIKTNGTATMRSSVSAQGDIDERFIAPPDLVQRMAKLVQCPVTYGVDMDLSVGSGICISTLPMPLLMEKLGWPGDRPDFSSVSGYNITAELENVDAYCTLYIPDQLRVENRISITGNRLTIEVALPRLSESQVRQIVSTKSSDYQFETVKWAMAKLGIDRGVGVEEVKLSLQRYAKILPIDESVRRNFIVWASQEHQVFSLGRFATWRPGLLLDDLVNDIRVIQRLARGGDSYNQRKK